MPDISLLIPLAEILDVSVTELLEGRKLDSALNMDTEQVEVLVKKALTLSDDNPEKKKSPFEKAYRRFRRVQPSGASGNSCRHMAHIGCRLRGFLLKSSYDGRVKRWIGNLLLVFYERKAPRLLR